MTSSPHRAHHHRRHRHRQAAAAHTPLSPVHHPTGPRPLQWHHQVRACPLCPAPGQLRAQMGRSQGKVTCAAFFDRFERALVGPRASSSECSTGCRLLSAPFPALGCQSLRFHRPCPVGGGRTLLPEGSLCLPPGSTWTQRRNAQTAPCGRLWRSPS